jgi:hypothetical protein
MRAVSEMPDNYRFCNAKVNFTRCPAPGMLNLKRGTFIHWTGVKTYMAPQKKENSHEIPDLTGLESENIIVRKKSKARGKLPFTESDAENRDRQPERKG